MNMIVIVSNLVAAVQLTDQLSATPGFSMGSYYRHSITGASIFAFGTRIEADAAGWLN